MRSIALALFLLFTPATLMGCGGNGGGSGGIFDATKQVSPREDLEKTLALWRVLATTIDEAMDAGLIDPSTKIGRQVAAAAAAVNAALRTWVANPDSQTYRDLAKGAYNTAREIYLEARK